MKAPQQRQMAKLSNVEFMQLSRLNFLEETASGINTKQEQINKRKEAAKNDFINNLSLPNGQHFVKDDQSNAWKVVISNSKVIELGKMP